MGKIAAAVHVYRQIWTGEIGSEDEYKGYEKSVAASYPPDMAHDTGACDVVSFIEVYTNIEVFQYSNLSIKTLRHVIAYQFELIQCPVTSS